MSLGIHPERRVGLFLKTKTATKETLKELVCAVLARFVKKKEVGKNAGHHRFADRNGADSDAGIVPAFGDDFGIFSGDVDGSARD